MELKKIQDADLDGKKVILRVDFNVAMEGGKIKERFKIKAARETVNYLLKKNCKIALISHLGRPQGKVDPEFSLRKIKDIVSESLGVKVNFIDDCIGDKIKKALENISAGEVLLLENVRFYTGDDPAKSDEASDNGARKNELAEFSKKLANGFNIFINDAFSASHRDQASITGVAKIIPSFAGWRLQKEIAEMEKIKSGFTRPAVAIIGGAKIETKLSIIKFFEKNYDYVLVGGKIANEVLDQKISFSEKVILPTDFVDDRWDIGPKTVKKFQAIIQKAKTIVWNGPLGKFEEEKYSHGTMDIFQTLLLSEAYKVAGGGETLEILEKNQAFAKFNFVSTGGGAMLEYLSGGKMPGIEILKKF
ncbi:phosphoglycerate kinase [Patescibacteria group bacterium]|nr:phosphoglycerate kinase [Patescibacteria group bacterium]